MDKRTLKIMKIAAKRDSKLTDDNNAQLKGIKDALKDSRFLK